MGFSTTNLIITCGAFLLASGVLLFLINIWATLRNGRLAGPNPWDAPTLEWAIESPPPVYNFAILPLIASRHPLREDRLDETPDRSLFATGFLLDQGKETLAVTPLDGEPDVILKMPGDSLLPVSLSVGMLILFGGLLAGSGWATGIGAAASIVILALWFRPTQQLQSEVKVRVYG